MASIGLVVNLVVYTVHRVIVILIADTFSIIVIVTPAVTVVINVVVVVIVVVITWNSICFLFTFLTESNLLNDQRNFTMIVTTLQTPMREKQCASALRLFSVDFRK